MEHMKKGFTILEILVVISVMVILIAIAMPRFKGMLENGNMAKVKKELKSIRTALESYKQFSAAKEYPPSTNTLTASYLTGASPQVISAVLYDPLGATPTSEYKYLSSSNKLYYVIWSKGLAGDTEPTSVSDAGEIIF